MAKKNELPALIASLLLTVALLGGGAWWLAGNVFNSNGDGDGPTTSETPRRTSYQGDRNIAGADGRSGVSVLPEDISEPKRKGLEALAAGDYAAAQIEFEAALQAERNDPESAIYLSNAKIGTEEAHIIAVPVPTSQYIGPALAIMRGIAQAQIDVNAAGGINGVPLKVLLLDDGGDDDVAADIAAALVDDPTVLGVVGHYSSDTTIAASKVYEAGQLPAISPTSTAVSIANAGDYIFRTVPSDGIATDTLARYVLNTLNKEKIAIFYTGKNAYSLSVRSEFAKEVANDGEIVAELDIDKPGFSAGSAVQRAKDAGAEVLMLALTEETEARSLQILSVNRQELPIVGGDSLYDFNILDSGQEDAVGLTVAVPWNILSHSQSPFVEDSQRLWGDAINWRTATAYDAVKALAGAIDSGGATREGIQSALSSPDFRIAGATDDVFFFTDGDRNQRSALAKVEKNPNGLSKTGYDYIPVQ